jgi:serine phosphatase RsbU (regulator of sigma subunit)
MRSAIVVPLKGRDRTFGAITLIRTGETARRYGPDELAIAEDVGRRAGMAIDNAQLHSQTRDVALQLQHAVLPDLPVAPPGWQLAAHYEPSSRAEVGGDFFDVVPLPDGRLAVVIGDVMGHGLPAAAAMAQIRAAIRGFATDDPAPARVIDRLQTMFLRLTMTRLVSVVYGVANAATHSIDLVNAGAMPPLLIGSDGSSELLPIAPRAALGADPEPTASTTWPLPAGHTLLLYTDGLVERRGQIIDAGFDRLRAAAGQHFPGAELSDALTAVVEALRDPDGHDDVTALAVRCT